MNPNKILIVQVGDLGGCQAKTLFDTQGIMRGREYILFEDFSDTALKAVEPNLRQLVLISYSPFSNGTDSEDFAKKVMRKNSEAIIFAFTSHPSSLEYDDCFDGIILTNQMDDKDPHELVREFIEGLSRDGLVEMIEDFGAGVF